MNAPDQDRRTIDPTPHRIQEFRKRGDIARSQSLTAAATSAGGALAVLAALSSTRADLVDYVRSSVGALDRRIDSSLLTGAAVAFLVAVLPAACGALLGYAAAAFAQLGAPPAFGKLTFDASRFTSFSGLRQLVDPKQASWRVLESILKIAAVGAVAAAAISSDLEALTTSTSLDARDLIDAVAASGGRLVAWTGGALLLVGLADFGVAKRRLFARMKMTPDELRREIKEQEGDPEIRKRRRSRMRELARRRIAQQVPKADVVVLNPTHYAVALRYRSEEGGAPRVVAKGKDEVAARIRELARENGVPMLRKPSLARLLFKTVREGAEIPPNLYRAVAEVLAYIYRVRRSEGAR
jgi:flagellar biosynthetic protein FlhB